MRRRIFLTAVDLVREPLVRLCWWMGTHANWNLRSPWARAQTPLWWVHDRLTAITRPGRPL